MAVVDSYTTAPNATTSFFFGTLGIGQSFTGNGATLNSAVFKMLKVGAPGATLSAKIYAHSGTFGDTSVPTGAALATSASISASGVLTSASDITFTFSGGNQITLANGTKYVVAVEASATGDFSNNYAAQHHSAGAHAGNLSTRAASWGFNGAADAYFIVNGTLAVSRRVFIV